MKHVPCKECGKHMQYPFQKCKYCGWRPEGKLAEKAKAFAKKYEMEHGIEPKKAMKEEKKVPGKVKPVPSREKEIEKAPKKKLTMDEEEEEEVPVKPKKKPEPEDASKKGFNWKG